MEKKIKELRVLLMSIGGFYMISSLLALLVIRMFTLIKGELKKEIGMEHIANPVIDDSLIYYLPLFFISGLALFLLGYRFVAWKQHAKKIILALTVLMSIFLVLIFKPLLSLMQGSVFDEMPNGEIFEMINYGTSIFQIICIYSSAIVPQLIVYRKIGKLDLLAPGDEEGVGLKKDLLDE